MERRFLCTACGACCRGWLPLTVADALRHAGRFPLALVWTPVRKGSRSFDLARRLGALTTLPDRRPCAVLVTPTAFLPPSAPCPALRPDGLCGIHDDKPLRCRTMPFYPWREEADQLDLLIPRSGWLCGTGAEAPVVYRDRAIVDRADFSAERKALLAQAPDIRRFAESLLAAVPALGAQLAKAAVRPGGGAFPTDFASLLPFLPGVDKTAVAREQQPVLAAWAAKAEAMTDAGDYARNYRAWAGALERFLPVPPDPEG